jgi:hypothetical protein
MPDEKELKAKLKRTLDSSTAKYIPDSKLDEAADRLIKEGTVTKELLEKLGADTTGDRTTFAKTNIDDIVDTLDQIKKKKG